jgi:hypothetical protein
MRRDMSPGPGNYNSNVIENGGKHFKISESKREMSPVKKDSMPDPGQYDVSKHKTIGSDC